MKTVGPKHSKWIYLLTWSKQITLRDSVANRVDYMVLKPEKELLGNITSLFLNFEKLSPFFSFYTILHSFPQQEISLSSSSIILVVLVSSPALLMGL